MLANLTFGVLEVVFDAFRLDRLLVRALAEVLRVLSVGGDREVRVVGLAHAEEVLR